MIEALHFLARISLEVDWTSCINLTTSKSAHLIPGLRYTTVLLLKCMQRLKAHVQLAWTIKFGKISQQELWFSHGRGQGFLIEERNVHM